MVLFRARGIPYPLGKPNERECFSSPCLQSKPSKTGGVMVALCANQVDMTSDTGPKGLGADVTKIEPGYQIVGKRCDSRGEGALEGTSRRDSWHCNRCIQSTPAHELG